MKKALLIVCAIVCSVFYVSAQQYQDVIYLKNGSVVRGVILEQIPGKSIKLATDNGSQFIFPINEVERMTKELANQPQYQQPQPQPQPQYQQPRPAPVAKAPKAKQPWSTHYKGEINIGYAIAGDKFNFEYEDTISVDGETEHDNGTYGRYRTVFSRPLFEMIHGVQVGPYLYFGAGIGLQYYCGKLKDCQEFADTAAIISEDTTPATRWNAVMLPIFANVKVMYPVNDKFAPFLNVGIGGTVGCYSSVNCDFAESGYALKQKARGGLYCDLGVGFRCNAFNFSIGYNHQALKLMQEAKMPYEDGYDTYTVTTESKISTKVNSFYVKIGVNF